MPVINPKIKNTQYSGDKYFENVALLLSGNGIHGSTNIPGITVGGTARLSSDVSRFGSTSIKFDGSSGCKLSMATTSLFDFTKNFTVECWVFVKNVGDAPEIFVVDGAFGTHSGHGLGITVAGKFAGSCANGGSTPVSLLSTTTVLNNTWYHLAFTRNGNDFKLFVNGILEASATYGSTITAPAGRSVIIGQYYNDTERLSGYINDFRFTAGICRYNSSFAPPLTSLPFYGNDLSADSVVLHLKGNGLNNGTTIIDSSRHNRAATLFGNVKTSTTQFKFDGSSLAFDGTGDYVEFPDSPTLDLEDKNFTFETWINFASLPASGNGCFIYSKRLTGGNGFANHFNIAFGNTPDIYFYFSFGNSAGNQEEVFFTGQTLPSLNTWYHLAVIRSDGIIKLFVDGIQKGSDYNIGTYRLPINSNNPRIGAPCTTGVLPTTLFNGYLDELRLTKGVARYTTNFVVPQAAHPSPYADPYYANTVLFYKMDGADGSTTFTDSSFSPKTGTVENVVIDAGNSKRIGTSAYFNGQNARIVLPSNITSGGTKCTIEAWVYPEDTPSPANTFGGNNRWDICSQSGTGSNQDQILTVFSGDNFSYYRGVNVNGTAVNLNSYTRDAIRRWRHIAVTFDGSFITLFVDGQLMAQTASSTGWIVNANTFKIGNGVVVGYESYQAWFKGWMYNFRITDGIARYTKAFIPDKDMMVRVKEYRDPLQQKVALHLPCKGTAASTTIHDRSINTKAITVNGTAQLSSSQSRFNDTSLSFDGSSGCNISTPVTSVFDFSKDFTIEFWVRFNAVGTTQYIVCSDGLAGTHGGHTIGIDSTDSNRFFFTVRSASSPTVAAATVMSTTSAVTNTWYHIAATKLNDVYKLFVNGILEATATTATAIRGPDLRTFFIGAYYDNTNRLNGYIEDFRFTSEAARYTSDFLLPKRPLPVGTTYTVEQEKDPYFNSVVLYVPFTYFGAVSNTRFLDYSLYNRTITPSGSAVITNAQSKVGYSSGEFLTSGSILTIPSDPKLNLGGNDFTIECWLRPSSLTGSNDWRYFLSKRGTSTQSWSFAMNDNNSGLLFSYSVDGSNYLYHGAPYTFSANTWYHVALVRLNNFLKFYVNGNLCGTGGILTDTFYNSSHNVTVGAGAPNGAQRFQGHIEQLRMTNGVGRYPGNFDPPLKIFPVG